MERKYILIISHDVVGTQMAGPGIRYYHLARVLSKEFQVTLAVPHEKTPEFPISSFRIRQYTRGDWVSISPLIDEAMVVVLPSDIASDFPNLAHSQIPLVVDGYDPLLAECLFLHQSLPLAEQHFHWQRRMYDLNQQYLIGDFFLCASERQRDWWLGLLEANGRINPYTLNEDPSLRSLIDVVAFGLPESPLQYTRRVIRSIWHGIRETDKVILWGGGLWPWLDPLTAIRAIAKVREHRQDVCLVFPGIRHPNPLVGETPTHNKAAIQLATDLALLNKAVFFGDWIPYADWANVLLESDLALSLHYDTLETRLAFRSRMLEYIWGGLPVVATKGDATSELVEKYDLGILVDYEDTGQVAEAIVHLLDTPHATFKEPFERARQDLTWEQAAQPLIKFCHNPMRSPDKVAIGNNLGSPYYMSQIKQQKDLIDKLQGLVDRYEKSRIIRFRRWLYRIRRDIGWL